MIREINYTEDYGRRLSRKRNSTGFPREVIFEITHRCNLRCCHCDVLPEAGKKELSTEAVKSVFDQLICAGCLHLTLTGGEPFTRKDILPLTDYARRKGLFIRLFTNATLITPGIADRLKEFQPVSLEISFHSLQKKRFDRFTRVAGSYAKTMAAIQLLKKRKIKLALKINITKLNLDEVEDLKKFAEDLGAVPEWATLLRPRSDGSKDNLSFRLGPEEVIKADNMLLPVFIDGRDLSSVKFREDRDPEREWLRGKLFRCGAGTKGLVISPYGELKPCLELPSSGYSVLDGGLRRGWRMLGNYIRSFKPSPENKCFDCKLMNFCFSCPARARLECADMNKCPDYYRRLAQLSAKKKWPVFSLK